MTDPADVLIIGTGPSGCSAAIYCAQRGMRVTLIEGDKRPRYRPGESLHPGIISLLKELGADERFLSAGFLTYEGNWVKWENDTCEFLPFSHDPGIWRGFQACRPDFDHILLARAKEVGVQVISSCRAISPLFSCSRVTGVRTSHGNLGSTFLIDSTGGTHWLARRMKLAIKYRTPRLIAHYGYVIGRCPKRDDAPLISSDKEGWSWLAKIKPFIYQWVRMLFYFEERDSILVPHEFRRLHVLFTKGSDVTWRIVKQTAGKGYYMVGDAAFVLDPLSGHGIIKAIMSGMMAGYLISRIINNRCAEEVAIAYYRKWISNWFNNDVSVLRDLYSRHPHAPHWI